MSKNRVIIVSGCDSRFFYFLEELLDSCFDSGLDGKADFGILDFGLLEAQRDKLTGAGLTVVEPFWTEKVPETLVSEKHKGLVARACLPDYFPSYDVYIWLDADLWVQTPGFFDAFVEAASSTGAAFVRENGAGYRMDLEYRRWWYGNMLAAYGPLRGLKLAQRPVINNGAMALSSAAPHWSAWIAHYTYYVDRLKKWTNQHSLCAAVALDELPCGYIDARCNWITALSTPLWDPERNLLCEPDTAAQPLSIVHLAGPDKHRTYHLPRTTGGVVDTSLTFGAIKTLSQRGV